MASSFMGLYVQREALVAAQKSLDIVGNNISNIKTKGYARQRVDVCSVANTGYNLLYDTSVSMAGQGVDVVGVAQYRDMLIDEKVRNYTTSFNDYKIKSKVMSEVETALDNIEADTSGFAVNLAKFKEAVQSFTADHADRQELANVAFQSARSVMQQLNYMNARLNDISEQTLGDAANTVTKINTVFQNMAALNKQITDSYVQMGYIEMTNLNYQVENTYGPLELKDNLNVLIDELSEYGDVDFKEEYNGSMTIWFAGQLVVYNDQYAQMAMTEDHPKPFDMAFEVTSCGKYDPDNERYTGLMKASEWNREIVKKGITIEQYVRSLADNIDITGNDKITAGTLRGYLDTYNGDGVFATDGEERAVASIVNNLDAINELTSQIKDCYNGGNTLTDEQKTELNNLMTKLQKYGRFELEFKEGTTNPDSEFVVTIGRQTVVENNTANEFTADNPVESPSTVYLGGTDVTDKIKATDPYKANKYQGIEYYRDMLNSFAVTFAEQLNGIYNKGIKETTADSMNTIISKLDSLYAADGSVVRDEDMQRLIDDLQKYSDKFDITWDSSAPSLSVKFDGTTILDYNGATKNPATIPQFSAEWRTNGNDFDYYIALDGTDVTENIASSYCGFDLFDWGKDFRLAAEVIRVTPEWEKDPSIIAHPERNMPVPITGETEKYDELSNDFIQKILGVFRDESFSYGFEDAFGVIHHDPETFNFEKFIAHISDNLGVQIEGNKKILQTTDIMLESTVSARDELMGVSMDEEGVDMMNYQKWYNAIARMVTTLDEALDKLINDTGLVGR